MPWTVYLARCRDGSLYTGVTTDLERRLAEHNSGSGGSYTRSRMPVFVVYWEPASDRSGALRRECAIKRLSRTQKEDLVAACSLDREPRAPYA
ncbi:MAG: GIY-YIG nuclease family protein [Gemmatimonadales bacterium]